MLPLIEGARTMSSDDLSYYRQRAAAERAAARASSNADIAEIHEELARLYDALVEHEQLRPTSEVFRPTLSIVASGAA